MLADNILLAITYWIPYADIFDQNGLEQGRAQVESIARVLQMIIPYLNEPERGQYSSLTQAYLSRA